ncbi:MAG: DDE-type integrase/transposase/recombinase [Candidatus Woesearchaeota archaeon]
MNYTNGKNASEKAREVRGYAIISKGDTPKQVGKNAFTIPSQQGNGSYTVTVGNKETCTCPDFVARQLPCKHIHAVRFFLEFNNKVKTENKGIVADKQACPYCHSQNTIGWGKRHTATGQKQRYKCSDCKRRFIENKDFERYKGNSKTTTLILDLYFKGISLRGIKDHLSQFYGFSLHHSNILRRIQKFSVVIEEYVKTLKPEVSQVWNHDEMKIQAGGKWQWLWNIMDKETKYLITTQVSFNAMTRNSDHFFAQAKEQAKIEPKYLITDGRFSLSRSIKREMPTTSHVMLTSLTEKRQNNQNIERLNGTVRDRIKPMRGFGNAETAEVMTNAFRNYYNFIKPHNSLGGLTPAQVAGIGVEGSENKWSELLKRSFAIRI